MNKILRYVLLSFLTIMTTASYATIKTVTIDFDNDYQKIFPTITGVSSSDSNEGDFTEVTYSAEIDGVTLIVTPEDGAKTPNRIWSSSPRLRMYNGFFGVMATGGDMIKKIEFVAPSKFNLTEFSEAPTEIVDKVWQPAGIGSMGAIFTVGGNTQLKSIVVTLGGPNDSLEGGEGGEGGETTNPLSKFVYKSGVFTESADGNQLIIDYVAVNAEAEITGKMIFDFENSICTKLTMSATFPNEEMAQLYYDDSVRTKEEQGLETVTKDGTTVTITMIEGIAGMSKIVIKSMMKMILDSETGGMGTKDSPLTPNQANIFAGTLEKGKTSDEDIYVKGKIASIKYEFNADKGTATFFISADGNDDFTFQCYSVLYLENKSWVDGNTQIKVGDEVIVCGKVTNYNGITPETASKKAYIYSLNGVTKNDGGDTPGPQSEEINVAQALDIINALADGAKTDAEYKVKGYVVAVTEISTSYGNATFTIADEKGGTSVLTVFRAKDAEGNNITDENLLKVDDLVVVQGKLQKYVKNGVMTPEVAQGGKILTINGKSTNINNIEMNKSYNGAIYNIAGQKVTSSYKGLVIINGRKFVNK